MVECIGQYREKRNNVCMKRRNVQRVARAHQLAEFLLPPHNPFEQRKPGDDAVEREKKNKKQNRGSEVVPEQVFFFFPEKIINRHERNEEEHNVWSHNEEQGNAAECDE